MRERINALDIPNSISATDSYILLSFCFLFLFSAVSVFILLTSMTCFCVRITCFCVECLRFLVFLCPLYFVNFIALIFGVWFETSNNRVIIILNTSTDRRKRDFCCFEYLRVCTLMMIYISEQYISTEVILCWSFLFVCK